MKVLLVGNGCSAIDQKMGKVIDSEFDLVLRMNRFKTEGYEEYVGSKTDVWVVSDNAFQWVRNKTEGIEGSNNWKNYGAIYIGIPSFKYHHFLDTEEELSKQFGIPIYIFPPIVGDRASYDMKLPIEQWPTLGMQCLYGLILLKHVKDIYIYGFDGKDKKYKYLHYYDDETNSDWETKAYYSKKLNHADGVEFNHIQNLAKNKNIKILQEHYKGEE